jgi:ABC-type transporter Mla subunit MlaD
MRRLIYICLFVAIVPWIVIGIVRESGDNDTLEHYNVRAVFDNAASLVDGEDVKVAGVPVGVVNGLEVTRDKKAAVMLRINNKDFIPFKADAKCTIRPQGLIGEKFVECEPGSAAAKPLAQIKRGDGVGARALPVSNTSSPVDIDLLNDILRLPYRQRFAILLSEFGTGLAGRGDDLNAVIHRANPALRETDKLLAVLANQNHVLARLARDSDAALGPLARERTKVSDWIVQANATGEASAERRGDISRGIHKLPDFLRKLKPLMVDLDQLAVQGTPLLKDLGTAAPQMDDLIKNLGTVSEAGRKSFPSLGNALERGRPALIRARPLIKDLRNLGNQAAPATKDLDLLTASLQKTGGVEHINDFLYFLTLSTNGFDSIGHYLRAGLVTNNCSSYVLRPAALATCNARFYSALGSSKAPLASATAKFDKAAKQSKGSVSPQGTLLQGLLGTPNNSAQTRQRDQGIKRMRQSASGQSKGLQGQEPMLDYLLGGGQ